VIVTVSASL